MSADGTISFKGVGKRFGSGPVVLDSVNLEISKGDFVSLIGPSGCGKSTLLRMVTGLAEPTSGEVRVSGATPEAARKITAHIFQDATLLPWLTVWKNIEAPLRFKGMAAEERRKVVSGMLDLVQLGDVAARYPRQLSGGMKMRVSVARALGQSPEVLLLDEPFGALDEMTRNRLNEELLRLRAIHAWTALFVTHSVAEAVFLSNRIVVLAARPGRIIGEVEVPFDFPRTGKVRELPEFQSLVVEVSRLLRKGEEAHA